MTNFDQLVNLIVSYGAENLRKFFERTGKNASYTSQLAVVKFIEAVGLSAEEIIRDSGSGNRSSSIHGSCYLQRGGENGHFHCANSCIISSLIKVKLVKFNTVYNIHSYTIILSFFVPYSKSAI